MNIAKYFWDLSENALKETVRILKDPRRPQFPDKMVVFLSRCDRPEELFSLISKDTFVDAWPKIRAYWIKRSRQSDFRDWWETIYEQLVDTGKPMHQKTAGTQPALFRKFGELIKEARIKKGLSQKQLALRIGMKQPDISRVEEGGKNITLYTVMRLCRTLKIKRIDVDSDA